MLVPVQSPSLWPMYLSPLHYLTRPQVNISPLVLHVTHTVDGLAGCFFSSPFVIVTDGGGRPGYRARGGSVRMWKLLKYTFVLPMIEFVVTSEA